VKSNQPERKKLWLYCFSIRQRHAVRENTKFDISIITALYVEARKISFFRKETFIYAVITIILLVWSYGYNGIYLFVLFTSAITDGCGIFYCSSLLIGNRQLRKSYMINLFVYAGLSLFCHTITFIKFGNKSLLLIAPTLCVCVLVFIFNKRKKVKR